MKEARLRQHRHQEFELYSLFIMHFYYHPLEREWLVSKKKAYLFACLDIALLVRWKPMETRTDHFFIRCYLLLLTGKSEMVIKNWQQR